MDTPNAPSSERPALSQRSIVVLRILLLLLAAGAVTGGLAVALRQPAEVAVRYVCPMHAHVRSATPGSCPICGMALEPVGREGGGRRKAAVPDMTAFENVRKHKIMGFVRMRSLPSGLQEMRGPSWAARDDEISAALYNDQIESLSPNESGSFVPTESPETSIAVTRIPGPAVPWDRSTSLIRFRVTRAETHASKQQGTSIYAGRVGWLVLAPKARSVVAVPVLSVLQEPEGPYVLVWAGGDRLEKRRFEMGEYYAPQGFAVVLSGLRPHDEVVTRATFFVDADRRLSGDEHPMWSGK